MARLKRVQLLCLDEIMHILCFNGSSKVAFRCILSSKWLSDHMRANPWCCDNVKFIWKSNPPTNQTFVRQLVLPSRYLTKAERAAARNSELDGIPLVEMFRFLCIVSYDKPEGTSAYSVELLWGYGVIYKDLVQIISCGSMDLHAMNCIEIFPSAKRIMLFSWSSTTDLSETFGYASLTSIELRKTVIDERILQFTDSVERLLLMKCSFKESFDVNVMLQKFTKLQELGIEYNLRFVEKPLDCVNLRGIVRLSLKNVFLTVSGPVRLLNLRHLRLANCPNSEFTKGITPSPILFRAPAIEHLHLISPHGIDVNGLLSEARDLKTFMLVNDIRPLTHRELQHLSRNGGLDSMTAMISWTRFDEREIQNDPKRKKYFSSLRIARLNLVENEEGEENEKVRLHFARVIWRNCGSANIQRRKGESLTIIRADEDSSV